METYREQKKREQKKREQKPVGKNISDTFQEDKRSQETDTWYKIFS